jgi:hypothetical protein
MPNTIPVKSFVSLLALMNATVCSDTGVSAEAQAVGRQVADMIEHIEQSKALCGAKNEAISQLFALADEYANDESVTISDETITMVKSFLRVLPVEIELPEFSVEPKGNISLDWTESRYRRFILSVGSSNRFAFAWLDGTNSGYGVENFDGLQIPKRIVDGITAITRNGYASFPVV